MTNTFYIQSVFYDILTNGFRDDINNNPERLGFILGAIDNGFRVDKINCLRAKRGKVEVLLTRKRDTDELRVVIFKGKEKRLEMNYGDKYFMWHKTHIIKGRFYLEDEQDHKELICSFS